MISTVPNAGWKSSSPSGPLKPGKQEGPDPEIQPFSPGTDPGSCYWIGVMTRLPEAAPLDVPGWQMRVNLVTSLDSVII